jgi:hypothetical protein
MFPDKSASTTAAAARRPPRGIIARGVVAMIAGASLAACSGDGGGRPSTPATLQIMAPAPGAVTGPYVTLRLRLRHARLVPAAESGSTPRGDRGHIHVSVDGQVIAMYYGLVQKLPPLTSGTHTIRAEFVAADHVAFSNRVSAAVVFRVR